MSKPPVSTRRRKPLADKKAKPEVDLSLPRPDLAAGSYDREKLGKGYDAIKVTDKEGKRRPDDELRDEMTKVEESVREGGTRRGDESLAPGQHYKTVHRTGALEGVVEKIRVPRAPESDKATTASTRAGATTKPAAGNAKPEAPAVASGNDTPATGTDTAAGSGDDKAQDEGQPQG